MHDSGHISLQLVPVGGHEPVEGVSGDDEADGRLVAVAAALGLGLEGVELLGPLDGRVQHARHLVHAPAVTTTQRVLLALK